MKLKKKKNADGEPQHDVYERKKFMLEEEVSGDNSWYMVEGWV